ncbi:MAG: lipopolysaccharide biosynthesis protein, partial [Kiloniellaceae bacterium]
RVRHWFRDGPLRRMFKNAGILLGGKTMAGLLELAAFAITARALEPASFGILIVILTYARLIAGLTKFQSWQAVIRYGAGCLEQDRRDDFQGLIKFTALLDVGSAIVGAAIVLAAAPLAGQWLGWDADTLPLAMLGSLLVLFTISATPTGILRLFDRFDLLAAQSTVTPTLRLLGSAMAYVLDAGLAGFVVAWIASGIAGRLALVVLGWRELARQGLIAGMTWSLRRLVKPHPGLWRFVWSANLSVTLNMVTERARPLIVSWILGPAAVALFEVARRFADAIIKPARHLGQSIYPELARLASQGAGKPLRKLVLRGAAVAGGGALVAFVIIAIVGQDLIGLIVGASYTGAYHLMVLLALASAISVAVFPIGPVMFTTGRAHILLLLTFILSTLYFGLLVMLLGQMGLIGAGIAGVARAATVLVALAVIMRRLPAFLEARRDGPNADSINSNPRA